jgi:UDP-galactopyranose mutase
MKEDLLIVGAGLFGSTFANLAKKAGKSVRIIDKRDHIAGNIYSKKIEGIDVHMYGPHIFHTNSKMVWDFVNQFTSFNNYKHIIKANFCESIYSFPVNLFTINQLLGATNPSSAKEFIEQERVLNVDPESNLENFCLYHIGQRLYTTFIKHYTTKQWGKDPSELPASIVKRLPIRFNYNDSYFLNADYEGIPVGGYTKMIENMIGNVPVELGVDFIPNKTKLEKQFKHIVYTGALDELFDYKLGALSWRSLKFSTEIKEIEDYQGCSIINYTGPEKLYPFTRKIEHKHFNWSKNNKTVVTTEYPDSWDKNKEKYYPVNTDQNNALHKDYLKNVDNQYIIGGRLGSYLYYDMDQIIAQSITKFTEYNENSN